MPQTSVDNSHFILLPFGIHFALLFSLAPGSIKISSNRINWIYCVPFFCLFRPYFLLNYSTNSVWDISFCTENHVCDMTASQIRLDFSKHILDTTASGFCFCCYYCYSHIVLPFQCRDGMCYVRCLCERIFHFYYTIGQLILHQQQKQWSTAKITQNRLMNDEVASIRGISDGHNEPWNKDLLLHLLLHLDFHFISHRCTLTPDACYCYYYYCSFCLHFASLVLPSLI